MQVFVLSAIEASFLWKLTRDSQGLFESESDETNDCGNSDERRDFDGNHRVYPGGKFVGQKGNENRDSRRYDHDHHRDGRKENRRKTARQDSLNSAITVRPHFADRPTL